MLTRGAVKAAAGAGAGAGAGAKAEAKALGDLWAACEDSNLKKLTAVLREHAAELEGALDTQDLEHAWPHLRYRLQLPCRRRGAAESGGWR